MISENDDNHETMCLYFDEDDCKFSYVYYFNDQNKVVVRAQTQRECPEKVISNTKLSL